MASFVPKILLIYLDGPVVKTGSVFTNFNILKNIFYLFLPEFKLTQLLIG